MKLYNLKKVVFIVLLSIISGSHLQAMSLRELMVIMFVCSPGTKMVIQVAAQKHIIKVKGIFGDDLTWERLAILPDGALVVKYPTLKLSSEIRNKNRFGTEYPTTERLSLFPCD